MGIDIRLPIGMLFTAIGLILLIFGLVSDKALYQRSLDVNINLWTGIGLVVFGIVMLMLGRRGQARANAARVETAPATTVERRTPMH
jgi:hypothetical protein